MKKILFLTVLFLYPAAAVSAIYKWTDESGKVRYGDKPEGMASKEIEIKENVYQKPVIVSESEEEVIMYSTSWCGYCKKARKYFINNKIPFVEYDIERDAKAKQRYKKFAGSGVPLILYDDKHMRGFSESWFRRIYKQPNSE